MRLNRIAFTKATLLLFALLIPACSKKNSDPKSINLRDFDSDKALTDTLKKWIPSGTPVLAASATMQANGFKCGERAGITFDTTTGKPGSGTPHLECWQSSPIVPGLQRRDWTVTLNYDSTGVRDVHAGYIIQP